MIAAAIKNDLGVILPYTCRYTKHQCEDDAENDKFFAPGVWNKIKELGAKVVQVEIKIIEE